MVKKTTAIAMTAQTYTESQMYQNYLLVVFAGVMDAEGAWRKAMANTSTT
jgi:hypothetical protein